MSAMIVNKSVEFLFQALKFCDNNTSQFYYSLVNDSGLITKISLENWSRSHQGQV